MKKWFFGGLCLAIMFSGFALAEDRMTITFKDGRTQSIDINTILKIEYQATQPAFSDITGTFKCREGLMSFVQTGTSVTGTYNWAGGGTTSGQMVGNSYIGNFRDKVAAGDFRYRFAPDRKSFQLDWRMSGETNWRDGFRCERIN